MLDEDVVDAGVGPGEVLVAGIAQVGEELVEDAAEAAGGDEAVEADGERLVRDAGLAEQRGQEAEQRERVVGREEAGERQELRLQETAGCGGGAAAPGSRERARRTRSAEKAAGVWEEKFRYLAYT